MSARKHIAPSSRRISRGEIVHFLRQRIVQGQVAPGDRLPTHADLQKRFSSSRMTVDLAMGHLQAEGFIRSRPKSGTFVAERPPHLWRFGLVFRGRPNPSVVFDWSRYYDALVHAAGEITRCGPARVEVFYDIDGHADSEATQQLLRQVATHQLAGLVFIGPRSDLLGSAVLEEGSLPRLLATGIEGSRIPAVEGGFRLRLSRMLELVRSQGRRRVAVITTIIKPTEFHPDRVLAVVRAGGMETRRAWIHAANPYEPTWMRHVIATLLDESSGSRPDALLITDDHLVPAAVEALWQMGVRSPRDMTLVGHWNFPLPARFPLPVHLIGSDARRIMLHFLSGLQAQQRGERPRVAALPPVLEQEAMSLPLLRQALVESIARQKPFVPTFKGTDL